MPAIYTDHKSEPGDSRDEREKKLYLAVMSCEEQSYTLGAAIAECRKKLETLDQTVADIKQQWAYLRHRKESANDERDL